MKSKGEKERYTHLHAEFQRLARRDKKAFLSDQCKEIDENNKMQNLEISSRKLEIQGTISCKDRHNKGQKLDLTEAEDIKKRWQEYREEQYKKEHHEEPDILESEVKWSLGIITMSKASGGDRTPAEVVQILQDNAVKVLHSITQQIWKTQQWPQDWKRSIFIPIPKKGNAKEWSNYQTIALISHASKVMLKTFQARLQQYMNCELPDIQAEFRKGRGSRDHIANICWIIKKSKRVPEKYLLLLY